MSRRCCPFPAKVVRPLPAPTPLLTHFVVHICSTGRACLQKITQLIETTKSSIPTFVIIDIPYDEEQRMKRLSREPRTPSPTSSRLTRLDTSEPDDIYAMHLLTHISSEISSRN